MIHWRDERPPSGNDRRREEITSLQQGEAVKSVTEALKSVTDDPDLTLGLLNRAVRKQKLSPNRSNLLCGSLLGTAVSAFESLVIQTIECWLRSHPQALLNDDKMVSLAEVLNCESMNEVIEKVIRSRLDAIAMKSPDAWSDWFETHLKTSFEGCIDDWPAYTRRS
jgi:hypothetical protein